jgi:NADH:ubiquinone oxidoreductase subunit F (NADH-binding)
MPIGAVLMFAGGLVERSEAILTGGYFGSWLPADVAWQLPLTQRHTRSAGAALGAGVIVALPGSSCGLAETARVVRYLANETAGQCGPCVFGLPALADALADLAYQGSGGSARQIALLTGLVAGRGACKHPDGATQLARSALDAFQSDAVRHEEHGPCYGIRRPPALPLPGDMTDW